MATKQEPIRRNDVIRCEKCGEDYSVTYKRCPFCDERPSRSRRTEGGASSSKASKTTVGGRRVAGGAQSARGGGYTGNVNPLQVAGVVGSLILIIAALYIVFSVISPLLGNKDPDASQSQSSASSSQSTPGSSMEAPPSSSNISIPEEPVVLPVSYIRLDESDFTLRANESHKINATVDPANAEVIWTSSNENAAKVSADGTVTNVNTGSSQIKVTITATAGDKVAECTVYCRGGSSGTVPSTPSTNSSGGLSAGSTGVVTGASSGLNVRSGPGSSNNAIASLNNGAAVKILEDTGTGWYKVSFVGAGGRTTEGYVSKDYIRAG